jgi:hypothetical protein
MSLTTKKLLSAAFLLILCFLQFSLFATSQPVLAAESLIDSQVGFQAGEIQTAFGDDKPDDIRYTAARIITIVLSLLGMILIIILIVAGFQYMLASGNEEKVKSALSEIKQALIGLVIILSAWSISYFVLLRIQAAVTATNYNNF